MTDFSRYLGVDHGLARIGIALSDPLRITARPLAIIDGKNQGKAIVEIAQIVLEQAVSRVVVGLPTDSQSEIGPQAEIVIRWTRDLKQAVSCAIVFWDETNSSEYAQAIAKRSRRGGKRAAIDDIAAAGILQEYLEADSREGTHEPGQPLDTFNWLA